MEKTLNITAEGKDYTVHITYKNIRSVYLRVNEDGSLKVSSPYGVPDSQIVSFIESRLDWVEKAQKKAGERESHALTGRDGKRAVFMGKVYPVKFVPSSDKKMVLGNHDITFYMPSFNPDLAEALFYQRCAQIMAGMVREKRRQWDRKICLANGIQPPRITIKYMTSRWGSCTPARHHISLSVRLMHYPEGSMDYVILHEYAHFLQGNHSRAFYDIIDYYMPEWREYDAYLKG